MISLPARQCIPQSDGLLPIQEAMLQERVAGMIWGGMQLRILSVIECKASSGLQKTLISPTAVEGAPEVYS